MDLSERSSYSDRSDQGRELISNSILSLCKKFGINKIQTAGYNPTGNASIERFHRYLLASLSIIFNRTGQEWDDCIPSVLFGYRASQHETTGYSPFYLETGRFPTLPVGAFLGQLDGKVQTEEEWTKELKARLTTAFDVAREAQKTSVEFFEIRNKERQLK